MPSCHCATFERDRRQVDTLPTCGNIIPSTNMFGTTEELDAQGRRESCFSLQQFGAVVRPAPKGISTGGML